MQELIVLFACLHNSGCESTVSTYRYYNYNAIAQIEQAIEPKLAPYRPYAPFIICGSGSKCVISLGRNVVVSGDKSGYSISYTFDLGGK